MSRRPTFFRYDRRANQRPWIRDMNSARVAAHVRNSLLLDEVMIFDHGFFSLRRVMHMCPSWITTATLSRSRVSSILSYEPNRY